MELPGVLGVVGTEAIDEAGLGGRVQLIQQSLPLLGVVAPRRLAPPSLVLSPPVASLPPPCFLDYANADPIAWVETPCHTSIFQITIVNSFISLDPEHLEWLGQLRECCEPATIC